MSAPAALRKAIVAELLADAGVSAIVGARVYDAPPPDAPLPFVSFGPIEAVDADEECLRSWDITVQLDAWTVGQQSRLAADQLVAAVDAALHEVDLELDAPYALEEQRVRRTTVLREPDGIMWHGILSLAARVELVA